MYPLTHGIFILISSKNSMYFIEGSKKTPCESVRDALKKYKDVIAVASAIAENFFEEKISYLKNKNKQFAALRDIEDQIKSECKLPFHLHLQIYSGDDVWV